MMTKTFKELVADSLPVIEELFPWDVEELIDAEKKVFLVDIREKEEFDSLHIKGSIFASRGILEACCDWGYAETIPELVQARDEKVILICRSGNRSALAALTLQAMGYTDIFSMKTGIKGWNDSDYSLHNAQGELVDADWADRFLSPVVADDQMEPSI
ncbi:MAG: rhodanese-like domain-containing protein [Thiotrichaceae bacterium]|nr:rhodanese-like domain-containing protein [Thiotrichaceae bacterium]